MALLLSCDAAVTNTNINNAFRISICKYVSTNNIRVNILAEKIGFKTATSTEQISRKQTSLKNGLIKFRNLISGHLLKLKKKNGTG